MRDKIWMVLAAFAVVVIVIVVIKNYNFAADEKVFSVDDYYMAREFGDRSSSERELYQQMTGARTSSCPATVLSSTDGGTTRVSLYTAGNAWVNTCFFIPNVYVGLDANLVNPRVALWDTGDGENVPLTELLNLSPTSGAVISGGERRIDDLFNTSIFDEFQYVEIIAPFTFTFDNVNTNCIDVNGNETISIVNSEGNIRITFSNTANWFCAGPVKDKIQNGTEVSTDGTVVARMVDWSLHGKGSVNTGGSVSKYPHATISGNTANAAIRGGNAGYIIGYAHKDTTFKIEYLNNGSWTTISLKHWLYPESN